MPPPAEEPVGLLLARTAKAVSRAFDDALAAAGGSRPTWLVLLALTRKPWGTQAELARELGITGPTLSHHLDGMVDDGLVTRRRDPQNRRVQVVELTAEGRRAFARLRAAAAAHDRQLRDGLDADDVAQLRRLLAALARNVSTDQPARPAT